MRIAILGAGSVGSALGAGWSATGHSVVFGVRDPAGDRARAALQRAGGATTAALPDEAVRGADAIVLAVPWAAAEELVSSLGDLGGAVLIDATNPLGPGMSLTTGADSSAAELIAATAVNARVVKAFNTTGAENLADPRYAAGALAMLIAGDDPAARATVAGLARELGFETTELASLDGARLLEAHAALWIRLAFREGRGRGFGFRLVSR